MARRARILAACLLAGCVPHDGIVATEVHGAWVFARTEPASAWDAALHTGQAAIVERCLQIGDAVVVWNADQLDVAEAIVARTVDGEALTVAVGGGGRSLVDDHPLTDVQARCAAPHVWAAAPGDLVVE